MAHEVVRLRRLFAGADAGRFTLPPEITVARAAVAALKTATLTPRVGNEEAVAAKLVEYVTANGKMPEGWVDKIKPAAIEVHYNAAASRALVYAKERADDRLLAVTRDLTDTILTDYLRPALVECVGLAKPVADIAVEFPWHTPNQMFKPEYNHILDIVADANQTYGAVREAQNTLREVSGSPDSEAFLFFGEFKSGIRKHWPSFRTQFESDPPWGRREFPSPARFVWLVANIASDLWMPVAGQVDRAWRAEVAKSGLLKPGIPA